MITCTIIIKELQNRTIAFAVNPEQSCSTSLERKFASIIDAGIEAASQLAMEQATSGESVAGEFTVETVKGMLRRGRATIA